MDLIYWAIVAVLFVLSFVGLIFPIVPSVAAIWGGFLVYQFFISPGQLSAFFWVSMGLLTAMIIVVDFVANSHFVKKYGGSPWGSKVAVVATIIGSFIFPPFGLIVVPFVAVLIVELFQNRIIEKSLRIAVGTVVGFLSSTAAKFFIQAGMTAWFAVDALM